MTMDCEEIRLKKGETYVAYLNAPITEKIRLLSIWKHLCLMYEDAYKQEVKGEIPHDNSRMGLKEETAAEENTNT